MKPKLRVTSFRHDSTFFFHIPKYRFFIDCDSSKKVLLANDDDISAIQLEILKYEKIIKTNDSSENKTIEILPEYAKSLINCFKPVNEIKTNYSIQIIEIIKELKKKINMSLKNIKKLYVIKYNCQISLQTISRVLRHKLKYHYLKTTVKNPLLEENNYKFMLLVFIKIILRSIKMA